jgi:hypothetical protein
MNNLPGLLKNTLGLGKLLDLNNREEFQILMDCLKKTE